MHSAFLPVSASSLVHRQRGRCSASSPQGPTVHCALGLAPLHYCKRMTTPLVVTSILYIEQCITTSSSCSSSSCSRRITAEHMRHCNCQPPHLSSSPPLTVAAAAQSNVQLATMHLGALAVQCGVCRGRCEGGGPSNNNNNNTVGRDSGTGVTCINVSAHLGGHQSTDISRRYRAGSEGRKLCTTVPTDGC